MTRKLRHGIQSLESPGWPDIGCYIYRSFAGCYVCTRFFWLHSPILTSSPWIVFMGSRRCKPFSTYVLRTDRYCDSLAYKTYIVHHILKWRNWFETSGTQSFSSPHPSLTLSKGPWLMVYNPIPRSFCGNIHWLLTIGFWTLLTWLSSLMAFIHTLFSISLILSSFSKWFGGSIVLIMCSTTKPYLCTGL